MDACVSIAICGRSDNLARASEIGLMLAEIFVTRGM